MSDVNAAVDAAGIPIDAFLREAWRDKIGIFEQRCVSGELPFDLNTEEHREVLAEAMAMYAEWLLKDVCAVPAHDDLVAFARGEIFVG